MQERGNGLEKHETKDEQDAGKARCLGHFIGLDQLEGLCVSDRRTRNRRSRCGAGRRKRSNSSASRVTPWPPCHPFLLDAPPPPHLARRTAIEPASAPPLESIRTVALAGAMENTGKKRTTAV